jgi:hypothetical protein
MYRRHATHLISLTPGPSARSQRGSPARMHGFSCRGPAVHRVEGLDGTQSTRMPTSRLRGASHGRYVLRATEWIALT